MDGPPDHQPTGQDPTAIGLDIGGLTMSNIDRDFTKFLDLKHEYHSSFIAKVREHVEQAVYSWEDLRYSIAARAACAQSFLDKYGMEFWGTEDNRKKYLMEDSLNEPEMMFIYPEKEENLKRILMTLLERKARGMAKARQARPPTPAKISAKTSAGKEETGSKRPVIDGFSGMVGSSGLTHKRQPTETSNSLTLVNNNLQRTPPKEEKYLPDNYLRDTYFLVTTSKRPALPPVWVRYRDFDSTTSFLEQMCIECGLQPWNPSAQFAAEGFSSQFTSPSMQGYLASVTLEWSGDELLVRPGVDADWDIIKREVQIASIAREFGIKQVQTLKIRVSLQVRD